jgi:predicted MFS family arabinose efflux permease
MEEKEKKRAVKTLTLASFLNDFGSDAIYPIWPLFVTTFLGANMAVLGFIDGLGDAIVSVSQALSGYYSDRIRKRKIFVTLGYFFGGISRIGYAVSGTWHWLIPFKILDRAGKMRGAPRDAIVADASTTKDRGKNFGILSTFDNLGAVCGILFSIALFPLLGYQKLFLFAAIPSLIGALLITLVIKEGKKAEGKIFKGVRLTNLDRNFKLFLILSGIFALGSFSYSFLLIFANKFGFSAAYLPVLYLIFTFASSLVSLPFGRYSDRLKSRKKLLFLSYSFWFLVCGMLIYSQSRIAIIIAFVLYGIHKGGINVIQKAFVSELSPKEFRASSLGAFQLITGLCALPASLIAGVLWTAVNPLIPFFVSLLLTTVSAVMLYFVKEDFIEAAA